ncbi:MAG: class I SAM-dependent methyltransferase [Actinobacteria bacterium]|nr:class I SAM-dependent methyltransferase [Actinomycetota bacterium]
MTQDTNADLRPATGWDETAAQAWVEKAVRVEDMEFPWRLAAELVGEARPETRFVLDAASGPGGFLAAILDAFPNARGVWFDASAIMRDEAQRALATYSDRVEFRIGDLGEVAKAGQPGSFDFVVTSRATHHLALPELTRFYQQVADLLVPGGWLANVDSMSESAEWRVRLRAVRAKRRAASGVPDVHTHPQLNVAPKLSEHEAALRAAGFTEIEMVWRVFVTGLLMARKVDPQAYRK